MLSGGVLSLPTLRLRADYFAITTIAISEIVDYVANNYQSLTGGPLGTASLGGPLQVTEYNGSWVTFQADVQGWLTTSSAATQTLDFALLVIVWMILLACLLVMTPMVRSPWGRVLRAIREDEDAAAALGKPVYWYKLQSLAIGAGFGAIAGLLYAFEFQNFGPTDFDPLVTFYGWLIVLISGAGRIWAVPVGALIFGFIFAGPTFLNFKPFTYLNAAQLAYLEMMIIGAILIGLMAWRPQGLFGNRAEMVLESSALLEVRDVVKHYGGVVAVSGDARRRGALDHRADRPQRGRQDDALQHHLRLPPTRARNRPLRRGADRPPLAAPCRAHRARTHLPADQGANAHDGARQHDARGLAAARRACSGDSR